MEDLRRFRGFVRTGLTAGALMAIVATGAVTLLVATGVMPRSLVGAREMVALAIRAFAAGAVAGGLFAWLVSRGGLVTRRCQGFPAAVSRSGAASPLEACSSWRRWRLPSSSRGALSLGLAWRPDLEAAR